MSLEFEATDGTRNVTPLFATQNIQTVRFKLGATSVELNSKDHADGSKTLDVLLRQNLDSKYIADHPHSIGSSSESQEAPILPQNSSDPEKGITSEEEHRKKNEKFEKEMRGWMIILATLFASITFQAGLNPPGGVWQDDAHSSVLPMMNNTNSSNSTHNANNNVTSLERGHTAGTFILQQNNPVRYKAFSFCNSFAFVYSMGAVFMMMSKTYVFREGAALGLRSIMIPNMLLVVVAFAVGSNRDGYDTISQLSSMFVMLIYFGIVVCIYKRKQRSTTV